jgi:hypothetical protein
MNSFVGNVRDGDVRHVYENLIHGDEECDAFHDDRSHGEQHDALHSEREEMDSDANEEMHDVIHGESRVDEHVHENHDEAWDAKSLCDGNARESVILLFASSDGVAVQSLKNQCHSSLYLNPHNE